LEFDIEAQFTRSPNFYVIIKLNIPMNNRKMMMLNFMEKMLSIFLLRSVPRISKAIVREEKSVFFVQTEGVNLEEISSFYDLVDMKNIYSNDINAVLNFYGVEAARFAIVKEIETVFSVYGINIDKRHLYLIADYMSFEGGYKAMNRAQMEFNPSPFLRMSFETTVAFLKRAAISGDHDTMNSPSARIVVGRPIKIGTNVVDIIAPLPRIENEKK